MQVLDPCCIHPYISGINMYWVVRKAEFQNLKLHWVTTCSCVWKITPKFACSGLCWIFQVRWGHEVGVLVMYQRLCQKRERKLSLQPSLAQHVMHCRLSVPLLCKYSACGVLLWHRKPANCISIQCSNEWHACCSLKSSDHLVLGICSPGCIIYSSRLHPGEQSFAARTGHVALFRSALSLGRFFLAQLPAASAVLISVFWCWPFIQPRK